MSCDAKNRSEKQIFRYVEIILAKRGVLATSCHKRSAPFLISAKDELFYPLKTFSKNFYKFFKKEFSLFQKGKAKIKTFQPFKKTFLKSRLRFQWQNHLKQSDPERSLGPTPD